VTTAVTVGRTATVPVRGNTTAVARKTARSAIRSGALWGFVFGFFIAATELSYSTIYKTQVEREQLAKAFGTNNATSALFGPAAHLQTVAGFTVLKVGMTLMILGAVWGLLTSTRLLRGEEDAGRWEILLTGATTRRGTTGQALDGLAAGAGVFFALAALIAVLSGLSSRVKIPAGSSAFFALAMVSTAVMFLAVGALTSQLAATRRRAAGYAAVFLGATYALRMVADSGANRHWLIWTTPLGWVEELGALTAPNAVPLVLIAAFTAVVVLLALHLAGTRDLGASTIPDRDNGPPHLALLGGPTRFSLRLVRPALVSWVVAIALSALLIGSVAKAAGGSIVGSSVHEVFKKLGAPGTGASAYLGVAFLMLAVLVACVACGQITQARGEEAQGRLELLLVRPVPKVGWLGARLAVALGCVLACGLVAGIGSWLGAISGGAVIGFAACLGAGVNVTAPAVFLLGLGALMFGLWPRAAGVVVYGVLGWSLLVELVGGIGAVSHWLTDLSLFHQMASAPAVPVDWQTFAVMVGIGLATGLGGLLAFRRRDYASE